MLVSLEICFFGTPVSRMLRRIRFHCLASRYMTTTCEDFRLSSSHYFGELGSTPRGVMAISKKTRHCFCVRRDSACDAHQLASASIPSDAPAPSTEGSQLESAHRVALSCRQRNYNGRQPITERNIADFKGYCKIRPEIRFSFGGQRSIQLSYGCVAAHLADRPGRGNGPAWGGEGLRARPRKAKVTRSNRVGCAAEGVAVACRDCGGFITSNWLLEMGGRWVH
jgi:hypothetical protein